MSSWPKGFYVFCKYNQSIRPAAAAGGDRQQDLPGCRAGARPRASDDGGFQGAAVAGCRATSRGDGHQGAPHHPAALRQNHPALRTALHLQRMHQRLSLLRLQCCQQGAAQDAESR